MLVDLIDEAINTILDDCVGARVGISLSGGLDSSTVVAITDSIRPGLPLFTGWYDKEGFDERKWSRMVGEGLHHEVLISPRDFVENFDDMCEFIRPPVLGMGTFGQWMVAKYANEFVDVMLSGEGSDELFGGYARQMIVAGEKPPEGYEQYVLPAGYPTTIEEALAYDLAQLPDLLAVDDQMTGAFGIEARAPFTDQRIVDYALALPVSERIGKRHLRDAVRGVVPDRIIDRKAKMGFPCPLVAWAQEEPVRSFVMERIGYLPDPAKPWDRTWWIEMVGK